MTTLLHPRHGHPPPIRHLVELACRAPSIGNSQPWRWRADGDVLELYADRSRRLPVDDPLGRQLMISCGAALHHLRVAATALGRQPVVERTVPTSDDLALLARIDLGAPGASDAARALRSSPTAEPEPNELQALRSRATDRSRFTAWPVPSARVEALARVARAWGDDAVAVVDAVQRAHLSSVVTEATRRHAERPGAWTPALAATDDAPDLEPTDGAVLLLGEEDHEHSWVSAGEALSALWLEAAHLGLGVVPLFAPIEIGSSREQLRGCLPDGAGVPLLLLRVSLASMGSGHLVRTDRRPLADTLDDAAAGVESPVTAGAPDSPGGAATATQ